METVLGFGPLDRSKPEKWILNSARELIYKVEQIRSRRLGRGWLNMLCWAHVQGCGALFKGAFNFPASQLGSVFQTNKACFRADSKNERLAHCTQCFCHLWIIDWKSRHGFGFLKDEYGPSARSYLQKKAGAGSVQQTWCQDTDVVSWMSCWMPASPHCVETESWAQAKPNWSLKSRFVLNFTHWYYVTKAPFTRVWRCSDTLACPSIRRWHVSQHDSALCLWTCIL